jgi:sugar-phosphatase
MVAAAAEISVQAGGVLFDNDGVLISSIGSVRRSWKRWAEHYGLPNAAEVEIPHGVRAIDIMQMLKPGVDQVEGLRVIEEMEIADTADLEVLKGVRALLDSLPPERWAIVTSATRRLLEGRFRAAELPVPERLISGEMVQRGKPDPEPYRLGAKMLGLSPEECVVVEDAPTGVGAGHAAGCRVLGVLGTHTGDELREAGAEWIVESLEDVQAERTADGVVLRLHPLTA